MLAVIALAPFGQSLAGDWVAIATNGVRVKETLHLRPDGRLSGAYVFTEKKWRKQNATFTGRYQIVKMQLPDENGRDSLQEAIDITWDGKGPAANRTKHFLLIRRFPAFTDILTTTFAPVGKEVQVYQAMYGKKYRPPWK